MWNFFYNTLRIILVYPLLLLVLPFKKKQREFFKKRFFQNFDNLKDEPTIMIHCSSMGETNLIEPLVRELLETREEKILISVFTDTGYENAVNRYGKNPRVEIIRFPLDDYILLRKIFKRVEIKLLMIIETEIWPNLINLGAERGRVILVNGRISDKSIDSYKRFKAFLKPLFKKIELFFMQSAIDCERIISLGADPAKVEDTGNLKFAVNFEEYSEAEKSALKELISSSGREIYVLGSTREGEEKLILSNFKKDDFRTNYLVIVPRHLERVEEIEKLLDERGFTYGKFSELLKNGRSQVTDTLIVDMMGVQRKFYSVADITFVGGTLVNIGGHSLLEPLFYGKTPIFGKYLQNVKEISRELLKRELGYRIESEREFLTAVEKIKKSSDKKDEIKKLFSVNRDCAKKIVEKIDKIL